MGLPSSARTWESSGFGKTTFTLTTTEEKFCLFSEKLLFPGFTRRMLACLFIAALYFTPGDCPPVIRVWEGDPIVLQYNTSTGKNLENETVDLKRFNKTFQHFEDLAIRVNGRRKLDNIRIDFNLVDLKSGVVTANISSATLSDSGLYQIGIPKLNKFIDFNVSVQPRPKEGNDLKIHDPTSSPSLNQANASTGGGDERNTSAIVIIIIFIIVIVIVIIIFFIKVIKKIEIWRYLKKKFHGQQQEDGVEMTEMTEPLNPQSAGESRSSCDPAASSSAAAEQLPDPDMATSSSSVKS